MSDQGRGEGRRSSRLRRPMLGLRQVETLEIGVRARPDGRFEIVTRSTQGGLTGSFEVTFATRDEAEQKARKLAARMAEFLPLERRK